MKKKFFLLIVSEKTITRKIIGQQKWDSHEVDEPRARVTQSETSQKEKNKYSILIHISIYGVQKNGIDEPICREGMEMQIQRMDSQTQWGKEGVGQTEKVASRYTHDVCQ